MTKKTDIEILMLAILDHPLDNRNTDIKISIDVARRLSRKLECAKDHYDEAVRDMTCDRFCDEWEGTNEVF
jgi:hypothetical protein